MNPLITIVIPVYNVEKYLQRCIDSILVQSFKDFEVILVNDGSTDNSGSICDEYKKRDMRIRVIHQKNSGAPVARNCALDEAKGDYIYFADSDDYIHPQMLELLYDTIVKTGADVSACHYETVGEGNISFESISEYSYDVITNFDVLAMMVRFSEMTFSQVLWNKLFKKEVIGSIRMNTEYVIDDFDFVSRVLFGCREIAVVDKKLYYYYQNSTGIMHNSHFNPKKILALQAWYDMGINHKKLGNESLYKQCMIRSLGVLRAAVSACCDGTVNDRKWTLYLRQQIKEKRSEYFLVGGFANKLELMCFYWQHDLFKIVFNILNPLRKKLKKLD